MFDIQRTWNSTPNSLLSGI